MKPEVDVFILSDVIITESKVISPGAHRSVSLISLYDTGKDLSVV